VNKVAVVTDSNVDALHSSAVVSDLADAGLAPMKFTFPAGEKSKNLATYASLIDFLAGNRLDRTDIVLALGGGVTGDLVGFAAATWMRGVDWVNVPTTLLSMVDASYGGKTACDLAEGKNLAGAFHPPRRVIIDPAFLSTLPARELRSGRAEMIKHEVIGALTPSAETADVPDVARLRENIAVKVGIVKRDPFEKTGERLKLNMGHTVAHAVERATDFAVSHGEAVAIGCVEEARLAERLGLASAGWADSLAARFAAAGLPTELPAGLTFDGLMPLMRGDKKREGATVVFALPCGPGDVRAVPI
jgi:3-dehydroquinate synthetase